MAMEDVATALLATAAAGSLAMVALWLLRRPDRRVARALPWVSIYAVLVPTAAIVWAVHVVNEGELGYWPAPWLALTLLVAAAAFGAAYVREWRSARRDSQPVGPGGSAVGLPVVVVVIQALMTVGAIAAAAAAASFT